MQQKTRRRILISGALVTAAVVGVAGVVLWAGDEPELAAQKVTERPSDIAQSFVNKVSSGDIAAAAGLTDAPAVATTALTATKTGMGQSAYQARLATAPPLPEGAVATEIPASVTWTMPNSTFLKYDIKIGMARVGDAWKVHWTPTVIHPQMVEGGSLVHRAATADGALLGRDGTPLAKGSIPDGLYTTIVGAAGNLNGTEGWEVGISAGTAFTWLDGKKPVAGKQLTVTIDAAKQRSAQAAVDALPQGAAIVAIDPNTTEILAVAQNKSLASTNPFVGRYAPGSTMKIVTAAAALQAGLVTAEAPVACPAQATIGTRTIKNDGFGHESVPFRRAFAYSCNTTFGKLGSQLPPEALPAMSKKLGLGADWAMPGADTNTGKVQAASGDERVENSFGQGTVQASPFGMALVAATVASGKTPKPTLLRGQATEPNDVSPAPPNTVLAPVRTMMRDVVTVGTAARTLSGFAGLHGKTGTAEAGGGTAHGWFVGYRGDVAFAVFVENAGSSQSALNATAAFLKGF